MAHLLDFLQVCLQTGCQSVHPIQSVYTKTLGLTRDRVSFKPVTSSLLKTLFTLKTLFKPRCSRFKVKAEWIKNSCLHGLY